MAVAQLLLVFIQLYSWILLARALLSWLPNLFPNNETVMNIYQQLEPVLFKLTEPVLEPIRKLIPPVGGTIDISLMVAFFGLIVLRMMLVMMI